MSSHYDNLGIEVCDDGHRCENGSICVEDPLDENNFYCDCDEANLDAAYGGLFCEHKATVYCTFSNALSRKSFCTNGGSCKAIVGKKDTHLGCNCPTGYEGRHCQFVSGTKPKDWPTTASNNRTPVRVSNKDQSQWSGFTLFGVIILSIGIVVGSGMVVLKERKKRREKQAEIAALDPFSETVITGGMPRDLSLEADGSGLQDIMNSSNEEENNESAEVEMIMDDEAEII